MDKLELKHKMKFSRKLTNKINRSLTIISESSHDFYNINIDNNSIENIANDNKTNDNTILQKKLCYISDNAIDISDNDVDINIPCNSELFNNQDNDINKFSYNITQVENPKNEVSPTSKIAKWAIKENITLSALRNLLSIIREIPGCDNIPKDPRTLLRTPSNIVTTPLARGVYYYFGIEKTLNLFCINNKINIQPNEKFLLAVNIDGLPLSKSSNSSFWPILCAQ